MHKRQQRKALAFAASLALLAGSMPETLVTEVRSSARTKQSSLGDFSAEIQEMESPANSTERFAKLRFDEKTRRLYRDEAEECRECCGFVVENGSLRVKASYAAAAKEQAQVSADATISIEEASRKIGCEVLEQADGSIEVISPFQLARLVVKSKNAVDRLNAVAAAEDYRDLHVLQFETPADAYAAYQQYQKQSGIEFVTPDRVVHSCVSDSSSCYEKEISWGNEAIGSKDYCDRLLAEHDELPEIKVAVLDTGIYAEHEMFQGRIAEGAMNFSNPDREYPTDQNGHGSHCAGIICASTPDNVKILPVAVLEDGGAGSSLAIYFGMAYAAEQKADVVSISLGGFGEDPLLDEGAEILAAGDIPTFVAAGNDTDYVCNYHPANSPGVIPISAMDSDYQLADFSNFGKEICFTAPGVNILSAGYTYESEYVCLDGTSMATPYAAACGADVLSALPDLTTAELKELLIANAEDVGEEGFDEQFGNGLICLKNFDFDVLNCAAPNVTVEAGSYDAAQTTKLVCETKGASIYYTLDGSAPSKENGKLYDGKAISISKTLMLRAVAMFDGKYSSERSFTYVIADKDLPNALEIKEGVLTAYHGVLTELDLSKMSEITAIGDNAFAGNSTLESILLPDQLTSIGKEAFYRCRSLQKVVGGSVAAVGDEAFRGCANLMTVSLDTIEKLGTGCFMQCYSLENVSGMDALTSLPAYTFCGDGVYFASLPNLTEVGDYALKDTMMNEDSLSWDKLTKLGAHALEGAGFGENTEIILPNVTSVGAYALASTELCSYTFSDQLTEIPEGLLKDCRWIQKLSAPAVTKIGDYGLAVISSAAREWASDSSEPVECDIDFSKVTVIGTDGLAGLNISDRVSLDSLEAETAECVSGFFASELYLPTVKRLAPVTVKGADATAEDGIVFQAWNVYLENVEEIADYAIQSANMLVFGDKVKSFGSKQSDDLRLLTTLAAPKGSPVEEYAVQHSVSFRAIPYLELSYPEEDVACYEEVEMNSIKLGFGLTGKWYVYKDSELYLETTDENVFFVPMESAEYAVHYELLQNGEMMDEASFGFRSVKEKTLPTIQFDEQKIIKAPEATDPEIRFYDGGYVPHKYQKMLYQPTKTEMQKLLFCDAALTVSTEGYEGWVDDTGSMLYPFEKGKTYLLTLDCYSQYSAIRIVNEKTELLDLAANSTYTTGNFAEGEISPSKVKIYYIQDEDMSELDASDYELTELLTDMSGDLYYDCFGKGDYFGLLPVWVTVEEPIELEKPVTTSLPKKSFTFTPKETGEYLFISMLSDEAIAECKQTGAMPAMDLFLNTYNPNAEEEYSDEGYSDEDSGYSYGQIRRTIHMKKGVEYRLDVINAQNETSCAPMTYLLTQKKDSLYDCYVSLPAFTYADGAVTDFSIDVFTDEEDVTLTEGKDYTCEYWLDDAENPCCVISVVTGIGNYFGRIIQVASLDNSNVLQMDTKIPIMQDTSFVVSEARNEFELVLQRDAELSLEIVKGTAINDSEGFLPIVEFQEDYGSGWYFKGRIDTENPTVRLERGVYRVRVNIWQMDGPCVLSLNTVRTLKYPVWIYSDYEDMLMYTGEPCFPDIQISVEMEDDDDIVDLTEGVDYEVFFYDLNSVECGEYSFEVKLTGDYIGSSWGSYQIIPPINIDDAQELSVGDHKIVIEQPGENAVFHMNLEAGHEYSLSKDISEPVSFLIYNATSNYLHETGDFGRFETSIFVDSEEDEYYLLVGFFGDFRTGEIPFRLQQCSKYLDGCTYEIPETIPYTGEDIQPDIRIYDGKTLLTEDVDYYFAYDTNSEGIGYAEYQFQGMGDYSGMLTVPTYIYRPYVQDYFGIPQTESAAEECVPITFNQQASYCTDMLKAHEVYYLNNDSDEPLDLRLMYSWLNDGYEGEWDECSAYAEETPDTEAPSLENYEFNLEDDFSYMNLIAFVYDTDGKYVSLCESHQTLTVAPHESAYVAVVSSDALYDIGLTFYNLADGDPMDDLYPEFIDYYTMEGATYSLWTDGRMRLESVDASQGVVRLYDYLFIDDENSYVLAGCNLSNSQWKELADQMLFYCDSYWGISELSGEYGWYCAALDSYNTLTGDMNQDYLVNEFDAGALNMMLTEQDGVIWNDALAKTADINTDGIVNVADVLTMLAAAQCETDITE